MSVTEAIKPPPIVVGVQGIDASVVNTRDPNDPAQIDWDRLAGLPPFLMFLEETLVDGGLIFLEGGRRIEVEDVKPILSDMDYSPDELELLFKDYCQWHKAKGCWPNEDPMGRLFE